VSEATASAMSAVINTSLFGGVTLIPPGDDGIASAEIDVNGAQQVAVHVGVNGDDVANVEYTIVFIFREPGAQGTAFAQTGTFSPIAPRIAHLNTVVPVYAPILQVLLRNKGSESARTVNSWVYGVRLASSS
jgi:hypothetical protein